MPETYRRRLRIPPPRAVSLSAQNCSASRVFFIGRLVPPISLIPPANSTGLFNSPDISRLSNAVIPKTPGRYWPHNAARYPRNARGARNAARAKGLDSCRFLFRRVLVIVDLFLVTPASSARTMLPQLGTCSIFPRGLPRPLSGIALIMHRVLVIVFSFVLF